MDKNQKTVAIIIASVIGAIVLIVALVVAFGREEMHPPKVEPSTWPYQYTEENTVEIETATEANKETTTEEETEADTETIDSTSMADMVRESLELYFDDIEVHSFEKESGDIYCRIIIDDITKYTDEKAEDFFSAAQAAIENSRFRYLSTGMITFSIVEEDIMLTVMHYGYQNLFLVSLLSTPNTGGDVVYAFKKAYNENNYFSKIDEKNILG